MSETNEPIETFEAPEEISDQSIQDFIDHGGEMPSYHTILQVWREVLSNAPGELTAHVTPQWANRITATYREINFADMVAFRDLLFTRIMELASVLESVIEADEDCLTYSTPEEDAEHNGQHYRDLLMHWQVLMVGWELDWDCTAPDAAVQIGVLGEIHKMFFGNQTQPGLTQYLDNIKLEYTEAHQAELVEVLEAMKEGR